ncbi:MAG: N-acetylglucosamine-6-phosphate isomerase [Geminicoccus sp.]|nr:N-acetylglucosamine-6-phosphate isomerase [Geminicoccus sp.]
MSETTTAETGYGAEAKAMLRVTVFGPESTGKTTLARHLSRRFDGLYMPEFGRVYTHALSIEEAAWQPQQLSEIASQHAMLREEIEARGGTRLMVEDTDVVKTAIWSDLLCGTRDLGFDWDGAALPDLYLLLTPETPFVQDVIRMHARQARREAFYDRCIAELERRRARFAVVSGAHFDQRTRAAEALVADLLGEEGA